MKSGLRAYPTRRRRGRLSFANRVAGPRNGVDQPALEAIVDLLAQMVDVHVDDVAARLETAQAPSSTVAVGHVVVGRVLRTGATRQRQHHSQTRYDKDRRPPMCRNGRSFGMLKCRTGILPCIPAVARAVPFRFGEELGAIGAPTIVLFGDDVRHAALYFRFSRGLAESGKVR